MKTLVFRFLTISVFILPVSTGLAQDFSNIVVFGGSYSDAGTYLVDDDSRRWTINPAPVWNQLLGDHYGIDVAPNINVNTVLPYAEFFVGGSNYAQGGARVFELPGETPYNNRALADQLGIYLLSTGGVADPSTLYSLEGGGNDIFYWNQLVVDAIEDGDPVKAEQLIDEAKIAMEAAAGVFTDLALTLADAGAGRVLMLTIHDIAVTPVANTDPPFFQTGLIDEVTKFNDRFTAGLAAAGRDNFVLVDLYRYIQELVEGGPAFGFTNVTDAACTPESQFAIFCTPSNLVSPDAASTHLFADWVHPSGPGHIAFYQYIQSLIEAPYLVGLTPEVQLANGQGIFRTLDTRLEFSDGAPPGWTVFSSGEASWLWIDGEGSAADLDGGSGNFDIGVEFRSAANLNLGAVFSASAGTYDFSGDRGGFDTNMYTGSAYATLKFGNAFAQVSGSAGYVDYPSISRHFDIYKGDRTNSGSTNGAYFSARIVGGTNLDVGRMTLTPIGGLSYQQARVDGYEEDQDNASTMKFGDQRRESLFATVGAKLSGETIVGGVSVRPEIGFALNHELLNQSREVTAGITDPGDILFATPLSQPSRNWLDVNAGAAIDLRAGLQAKVAIGGQLTDDSAGQFWGRLGVDFKM